MNNQNLPSGYRKPNMINKEENNMNNQNYNLPTNEGQGPSLIAKLVAAALAFAYVGSPVDIIPDFIPVLGQVDDITAIYLAYRYIFLNGK